MKPARVSAASAAATRAAPGVQTDGCAKEITPASSMNKSEVRLGADLFAKRRPARRRHQFQGRKRATTDENLATDCFGDVSRVVVALHETEETRL